MNNLLLKKDMTAEQLSMTQTELDKKKKNEVVMYVLWLFLGGIGGHRYYMGDIGYAIGMTLTLGGFGLWTLIDLFIIGKRLKQQNEELESEILVNVKAMQN